MEAAPGASAYRYSLRRDWPEGARAPVLFVLLNPSTGDEHRDDATVRRCIAFARRWEHRGLRVANLYGRRAVRPRELWAHLDPVGPEADQWLVCHLDQSAAGRVVVGWGASARPDRVWRFGELLAGRPAWCLGLTANGQPRHPLYVRGDIGLQPWRAGASAPARPGPPEALVHGLDPGDRDLTALGHEVGG